jgi:hypothetical protein
VRELVSQAPKLLPINGHRYLLVDPCRAGNPVLSVYQSDIIVYGGDLRDYFFLEYGYYLSSDAESRLRAETTARPETIPFWGEFL